MVYKSVVRKVFFFAKLYATLLIHLLHRKKKVNVFEMTGETLLLTRPTKSFGKRELPCISKPTQKLLPAKYYANVEIRSNTYNALLMFRI